MKKTTLEFNEELYEEARAALGTKGLKATVQKAFEEAVRARLVERHLQRLRTMDGLDLDKPEVMANAWRKGRAT